MFFYWECVFESGPEAGSNWRCLKLSWQRLNKTKRKFQKKRKAFNCWTGTELNRTESGSKAGSPKGGWDSAGRGSVHLANPFMSAPWYSISVTRQCACKQHVNMKAGDRCQSYELKSLGMSGGWDRVSLSSSIVFAGSINQNQIWVLFSQVAAGSRGNWVQKWPISGSAGLPVRSQHKVEFKTIVLTIHEWLSTR